MPERKISVGKLQMREYAAAKPVAITSAGVFVKPSEMFAQPSLALGSLHSLDIDLQVKLTAERTRLEPDFSIGVFGVGNFTKKEILEHVEAKTPIGLDIVNAEMAYCNELIGRLAINAELPTWPKIPDIPRPPLPKDWDWVPTKYRRFVKSIALFAENTTDAVTKFAADYRIKYVHPVFQAKGFVVVALTGIGDNAYNFALNAKSARVVYISGIGHGSPDCYTGYLNQALLRVGSYDPAIVKHKSMHFLSCQTAKQLGPDTVIKGARSYAGYFENFTFVYDTPSTPVNEMDLFWKADSTFDLCMANGATVEAAHIATMAAYDAALALVPNTAAATWLNWDKNYFRDAVVNAIYGDKQAKIFPWMLLPWIPFLEVQEQVPALRTLEEEEKETYVTA